MAETIIVAVITAAASIVSNIIISSSKSKDTDAKLDKTQAVMQTELAELTREVRKHNGFAERMPVVEEQIKVINHRIQDLENKD